MSKLLHENMPNWSLLSWIIVHVSPVQYLWLKLKRKLIALASILCTMDTQKQWRKVQFPLYILSKKNLGENGEKEAEKPDHSVCSKKTKRGLRHFKSSMYYVFDISQSMEALRIPISVEGAVSNTGWRENVWMRVHFSCLPPATFLNPSGQPPAYSAEDKALQEWWLEWAGQTWWPRRATAQKLTI